MIDLKKINPSWIKLIGGLFFAAVVSYQAIQIATDTNNKQDRQLHYLQDNARKTETKFAVQETKMQNLSDDVSDLKAKLDADAKRQDAIYEKLTGVVVELQKTVSRLDATIDAMQKQNKMGR